MNCAVCHYRDKSDKKLGPGLKALFKNRELPQSHRPVAEVNLRAQIGKGSAALPAFGSGLSAAEISNLLAYLKTL